MASLTIQTTGVTDTYIDQANADTNTKTNNTLYAQLFSAGRIIRTFLRFDLATLPANAIIDSAVLTLTAGVTNNTRKAASIYRILSSGANENATWNRKNGIDNWDGSAGCSTSGTDYAATAIGTYPEDTDPTTATYDVSLTVAAIELMRITNNGMLIKADNETEDVTTSTWCSTDHATSGNHPKLVIIYHILESGYSYFL